jgi:hypothetical protein
MPVLGNIADRLIYGLTIPTTIRALVFNSTPTTTSPGPINNYYRRYVYKVIYTVAELQSAGWTKGMTIRRISFYVTNQPTYQPYPSYTIGMINTASAVGSDITAGWTTVRNAANISFTASQENIITLDTAFAWNGTSNLGIGFAWGQSPTNWSSSGVVESNTTGSARFAVTDGTGTYLLTDVASSTGTGRPAIRLYA